MNWKIAEAKQRFSELVRKAAEEPQRIYNRDHLVAVMLDAEDFETFEAWREKHRRPTMAEAIDAIHRICLEEDYELSLPDRRDRRNPFAEALDEVPV